MIQEKFVDWHRATVNAIRAYQDMDYILSTSSDLASDLEDRLTKPGGSNVDRQPVSGGGSRTEDSWAYCIDQLDTLESKRKKAQEYMDWFRPAWGRLTEEERIVLEEHYMIQRIGGRWMESAANRLHIERSSVYRLNDAAVDRLSSLLYGP